MIAGFRAVERFPQSSLTACHVAQPAERAVGRVRVMGTRGRVGVVRATVGGRTKMTVMWERTDVFAHLIAAEAADVPEDRQGVHAAADLIGLGVLTITS